VTINIPHSTGSSLFTHQQHHNLTPVKMTVFTLCQQKVLRTTEKLWSTALY